MSMVRGRCAPGWVSSGLNSSAMTVRHGAHVVCDFGVGKGNLLASGTFFCCCGRCSRRRMKRVKPC